MTGITDGLNALFYLAILGVCLLAISIGYGVYKTYDHYFNDIVVKSKIKVSPTTDTTTYSYIADNHPKIDCSLCDSNHLPIWYISNSIPNSLQIKNNMKYTKLAFTHNKFSSHKTDNMNGYTKNKLYTTLGSHIMFVDTNELETGRKRFREKLLKYYELITKEIEENV